MKSALAALRTLVLPGGASSGPMIVIDGINGTVLVYDGNNELIGSLAAQSGVDPFGGLVGYTAGLNINPGSADITDTAIHLDPTVGAILFWPNPNNPGAGAFNIPGSMQVVNNSHNAAAPVLLSIRAPAVFGSARMEFELQSVSRDGVTAGFLTKLRPEGSTSDVINNAHTVFIGGNVYKQTSTGGGSWGTEVWTNAALAVNWVTLPEPPAYKLHLDGTVALQGGAFYVPGIPPNGTVVFTLPAGYRPIQNRLYIVPHWGVAGWSRMSISAAGVVQIFDAPNNQPTFDEIRFSNLQF